MSLSKTVYRHFLSVVLIFALAACAAPPTAAPTVDVNPIYTQAAGTIQANLTRSAALTPSFTPTLPPSDTPAPTATIASTPTAAATPLPVATDTEIPSPDQVQFISQSPADDSYIPPSTSFTLTWTIKNVGATTWSSRYRLRFFSGEQMGGKASYALPKVVAPNDSVDLSVNLTAPQKFGRAQTVWVLTNADGHNFYPLTSSFNIDFPPATPTLTITPTGTLTITPTVTLTPTVTKTP